MVEEPDGCWTDGLTVLCCGIKEGTNRPGVFKVGDGAPWGAMTAVQGCRENIRNLEFIWTLEKIFSIILNLKYKFSVSSNQNGYYHNVFLAT